MDEFSENFHKGGRGGVIFNPKIYAADFDLYRGLLMDVFQKKLQQNCPKMRGGGPKAVLVA